MRQGDDFEVEFLSLLDLAAGKVHDILRQEKLHSDLLFSVEWQPLQGDDQIVLPTAPKPGSCGMAGSRTIRKTKLARIFTENYHYYGCLYATARIVRLEEGGGIGPTLGELALAGPLRRLRDRERGHRRRAIRGPVRRGPPHRPRQALDQLGRPEHRQ